MQDSNATELFGKAPVSQAVLKSALSAMAAMLMVLIYNLADTFFVGQTHDAYQVAAVSLAMPVFLIFMEPILTMVGASEGTWAYAKSYLTIVSFGGPFVLISNAFSNIIRAEGKSAEAMMG